MPEDKGDQSSVLHVPFNPLLLGLDDSPLGRICAAYEGEGWRLDRVVPSHQFEVVAVFVRDDNGGSVPSGVDE